MLREQVVDGRVKPGHDEEYNGQPIDFIAGLKRFLLQKNLGGYAMSLPLFLLLAAINEAVFGLGFLLAPDFTVAPMGVVLNPAGAMIARILGAALIFMALVFFWLRNAQAGEAKTAVLRAGCIYYVVSAVPIILGITSGLANASAWGTVLIHVLLAFGFWHFGCRKS